MLNDWALRLRSLFKRTVVERELDDELQFHFEQQVESHMRKGLARDEAVRRARLEFGAIDQIKEDRQGLYSAVPEPWQLRCTECEGLARELQDAWRSDQQNIRAHFHQTARSAGRDPETFLLPWVMSPKCQTVNLTRCNPRATRE